ncbi:Cx9C motif-containing protein 4, mitochondrial [Cladorrhinum sp. PSN332]|nr:Cx9C motif-containing protein 4, mitochondrial [Cladorrhinum sp. PSN332]
MPSTSGLSLSCSELQRHTDDVRRVPLCSARYKVILARSLQFIVHMANWVGGVTGCLTKNGFNQEKCEKFVDALYECCQAFYERNSESAVTASCPKASLLKLKLEQRKGGS